MVISDLSYLEVATEESDEVLGGACRIRRVGNFRVRACVPGRRRPTIAVARLGGRRRFGDDDNGDDDNGDDNGDDN